MGALVPTCKPNALLVDGQRENPCANGGSLDGSESCQCPVYVVAVMDETLWWFVRPTRVWENAIVGVASASKAATSIMKNWIMARSAIDCCYLEEGGRK